MLYFFPDAISRGGEMSLAARAHKSAAHHRQTEQPIHNERIENLLRNLLSQTSDPGKTKCNYSKSDENIHRYEIDGICYTIICSRPVHLSPREQEIARLVAQGLPNKCIGDILDISTWTVATHLRRIFAKLDVTSRAAMTARLTKKGVIL
jgi:two-component system, NarL family, nitrate/nitrite response regulator NarL